MENKKRKIHGQLHVIIQTANKVVDAITMFYLSKDVKRLVAKW